MVKFRKRGVKDIANNRLERWMTYFDVTTPEEVIEEVIKMDSAINKANERLNFVTQDKDFLRNYHLREMAMSDWTTGVNTAFEKGEAKGEANGIMKGIIKGEAKKANEVAKNALRKGLPVDVIQEITGLDIDAIRSLE
jgi:predicted transposase/invertase (TIGR01784 family)